MKDTEGKPYIFLDPDGTQDFGLLAIVAAPTGVIYAHQCGGLATLERGLEGFAVPLGAPAMSQPLRAFFHTSFRGNPPDHYNSTFGIAWTEPLLQELRSLVERIAFWKTHARATDMDDERPFLTLDMERIDELTEAWIPVHTPYGPGILLFANSD